MKGQPQFWKNQPCRKALVCDGKLGVKKKDKDVQFTMSLGLNQACSILAKSKLFSLPQCSAKTEKFFVWKLLLCFFWIFWSKKAKLIIWLLSQNKEANTEKHMGNQMVYGLNADSIHVNLDMSVGLLFWLVHISISVISLDFISKPFEDNLSLHWVMGKKESPRDLKTAGNIAKCQEWNEKFASVYHMGWESQILLERDFISLPFVFLL